MQTVSPASGAAAPDVLLVGGGLANGLIALRLRQLRPELELLVLEIHDTLGGNHTWSFHTTDLTPAQLDWIQPLVTRSWPQYRVVFPAYERTLHGGYHSISSQRFHQILSEALAGRVWFDADVREVGPDGVVLDTGQRLAARCVVDGRGYPPGTPLPLGYQKFLGLQLELDAPHGLDGPVLMDTRYPQSDGYRFVYLLPWSEHELLVEDTYYSDSPRLERDALRADLLADAARRGWRVRRILREECGVLPIPLAGQIDTLLGPDAHLVPRSGLRAGLFHPTTGYSLPCAVRLAEHVAALPAPLLSRPLAAEVNRIARQHWRDGRFFRLLNRMLFRAAAPEQRFRVFEHFYRASPRLVERFYAGRLTRLDRLRILSGRPPVPVLRALRTALDDDYI